MPAHEMKSTRLEAFSDGVIAVIITIMVLELHVPEAHGLGGFLHILPRLVSFDPEITWWLLVAGATRFPAPSSSAAGLSASR